MYQTPSRDHALRLLHLGDSYTIGEGVPEEKNWPAQFRGLLADNGHVIGQSRVIAQTGWTTADLIIALREEQLIAEWDLITLCIGVNNQYQGRPLQEYQQQLTDLVKLAKPLLSSSQSRLVLLSIPDWSVSPFAMGSDRMLQSRNIDQFNDSMRLVAVAGNVPMVEWTRLSRQFAETDHAFAEDGLHPSAEQYGHWARHLAKQLSYAG